jgi:hypothetical protein
VLQAQPKQIPANACALHAHSDLSDQVTGPATELPRRFRHLRERRGRFYHRCTDRLLRAGRPLHLESEMAGREVTVPEGHLHVPVAEYIAERLEAATVLPARSRPSSTWSRRPVLRRAPWCSLRATDTRQGSVGNVTDIVLPRSACRTALISPP